MLFVWLASKCSGHVILESTSCPRILEDPLDFRPQHFYKNKVNATELSIVPFGVGQKICPPTKTVEFLLGLQIEEFQRKAPAC